MKEPKVKPKDIKEEKEDGDKAKAKVKVKEEADVKEADKAKKKKEKKEKKDKEKKEKNVGPVHITANGEPIPLDDGKELDKTHPLWDEVG